jgi:hypothetical protein
MRCGRGRVNPSDAQVGGEIAHRPVVAEIVNPFIECRRSRDGFGSGTAFGSCSGAAALVLNRASAPEGPRGPRTI